MIKNFGYQADLHQNKRVREETVYIFQFQIEYCCEWFVPGKWNCHCIQRTKTKKSSRLSKASENCTLTKTAASGLQSVLEASIYISNNLYFYYVDLPCVATIYLLLVIEFRLFLYEICKDRCFYLYSYIWQIYLL